MKPQLKTVTSGDQLHPSQCWSFLGVWHSFVPSVFISSFLFSIVILEILIPSSFSLPPFLSGWLLKGEDWNGAVLVYVFCLHTDCSVFQTEGRQDRERKHLFLLPEDLKLHSDAIWWRYTLLFNSTNTLWSPVSSKLFWAILKVKVAFSLLTENVQKRTG